MNTGRLQIPTRASRQTFWVARIFFSKWHGPDAEPLAITLAPNVEDVIISSQHQRCRVRVVKYCVACRTVPATQEKTDLIRQRIQNILDRRFLKASKNIAAGALIERDTHGQYCATRSRGDGAFRHYDHHMDDEFSTLTFKISHDEKAS